MRLFEISRRQWIDVDRIIRFEERWNNHQLTLKVWLENETTCHEHYFPESQVDNARETVQKLARFANREDEVSCCFWKK